MRNIVYFRISDTRFQFRTRFIREIFAKITLLIYIHYTFMIFIIN